MSNPTPTNFSCIDNRQKVYIWNAFASNYGWQVILFNNIDEFEYLMDDMPNNQGTKEERVAYLTSIAEMFAHDGYRPSDAYGVIEVNKNTSNVNNRKFVSFNDIYSPLSPYDETLLVDTIYENPDKLLELLNDNDFLLLWNYYAEALNKLKLYINCQSGIALMAEDYCENNIDKLKFMLSVIGYKNSKSGGADYSNAEVALSDRIMVCRKGVALDDRILVCHKGKVVGFRSFLQVKEQYDLSLRSLATWLASDKK